MGSNPTSPRNAAPVPRNVARAVVIKDEDIFMLAEHDGGIPAGNLDGFGLYYHDCRFLDGYELRIAGTLPNSLVANSDQGSMAQFELTNVRLTAPDAESIDPRTFSIALQRIIDSNEGALRDQWTIENHDLRPHRLPLSFRFHSAFEDIFVIRGLHPKKSGREEEPRWDQDVLVLGYDGADGVNRRLEIHFDPKPDRTSAGGAEFHLSLAAGQSAQIGISFRILESSGELGKPRQPGADPAGVASASHRRSGDWLAEHAELRSNNPLLNEVVRRCLLDLLVLRSSLDGCHYFSAGLPWYGALFGRDSLITALQTLAFEPGIAEQTLRLLARYQGRKQDEWRDEEPGKILHELRRGELARLNEIPQTPYYGSVDATPLFLILLGEHARWTGSLQLFRELRASAEAALAWIDRGCRAGEGAYLSYATRSSKGLGNQGWKDSGDSIMNADGSLAEPPIALVEVQGYVYRAKRLMAELYERDGDPATAARLRAQAADLRARFNRDFWLDDLAFYALALQKGNRPAAVVSSNPGQALWTGIVEESRAPAVVRRLMAPDMFSGWGIRTLAVGQRRANPIGYHLGTVWPHDNSLIAAGFRRYGSDAEAAQVLGGILHAARYFEHYRLPEVFAGFSRRQFTVPVRYPVACHPQAWAAGSVPFMLASALGLVPDAFQNRLLVVRPVLPEQVEELELRRISIGPGSVDLRFRRTAAGAVEVQTLNAGGGVEVRVEVQSQTKAA